MGISYLFLDPPRPQPGDDASAGGGLPPTFLSNAHALGPIRYAFANDPAPIFTDPSLPPDERAATRAAEQFRRGFASAWNDYSRLGLQDAVDGYADFAQTLDVHRAKVLGSVSGPAQQILKPALDQLHFEGTEIGLDHWHRQSQAVRQQFQAAQAKRAQADEESVQSLVGDLHEAHHAFDDPAQLQNVAQRGGDTWLQIAQRNGWSQQQLDQQRAQWNGQLYGVAIARHLDNGDVAGAKTVLANAQARLDPQTFGRLSGTVDAGIQRIEAERNEDVSDDSLPIGEVRSSAANTSADTPPNIPGEYRLAALGGFAAPPKSKPLVSSAEEDQTDDPQAEETDDTPRIILAQKGRSGGGRRGGWEEPPPDTTSVVSAPVYFRNLQIIRRLDPGRDFIRDPNAPISQEEYGLASNAAFDVAHRWAVNMANGHAFKEHAREYVGNTGNRGEFANIVRRVILNPQTEIRPMNKGATAFYEASTRTLVIIRPHNPQRSSMFEADRDYVDTRLDLEEE
jgi:hypothetical protein